MSTTIDALELARALIRCPSVTPEDGGSLATLQAALEPLGFTCHRLRFSEPGTADVDNLYARWGSARPNFCFAGHTDVVPLGDPQAWSVDPFGAELHDGMLYGRGAADMKSAIACFAAAASRILDRRGDDVGGSISLLITGDEEAVAINGTAKVLQWLEAEGEALDVCLVGEPTNPMRLGEMVKIGRRGSLSGSITVTGVQGHTAYPQLADNPLPRLLRMLTAISETALDEGTEHFQPSNLQLTTIDVGNTATNVIPGVARAAFNTRFNDLHTSADLIAWLERKFDEVGGGPYELDVHVTGEAFVTQPNDFTSLLVRAIEQTTGIRPELSTTGGNLGCPVYQVSLPGRRVRLDRPNDAQDRRARDARGSHRAHRDL